MSDSKPQDDPRDVKSLHGTPARLGTIQLADSQEQAWTMLAAFGRQVFEANGITWTSDHDDRVRLLVGAIVDAAEERMSSAIIEVAAMMTAEKGS